MTDQIAMHTSLPAPLQLQVARDRITGFPCVRFNKADRFVGLFPVTKLQAEQWIAEGGLDITEPIRRAEQWIADGGLDDVPSPSLVTALIRRLECQELPKGYPEEVQCLRRAPVSKLQPDNLFGLIATNLTLWDSPDEVSAENSIFPTPKSQWGMFVQWSGGSIPASRDWRAVKETYAALQTKDLLNQILKLGYDWHPCVEELLRRYGQVVKGQTAGLPFMPLGFYELISDTRRTGLLTSGEARSGETYSGETRTAGFPCVAGESALWPILEAPGSHPWRAVLFPQLPVVALRLWYDENQVIGIKLLDTVRSAPIDISAVAANRYHSGSISSLTPNRGFTGVRRSSHNTMDCICPICYQKVPPDIFSDPGPLWCWWQPLASENSSTPEAIAPLEKQYVHANRMPKLGPNVRDLEATHADYRAIAKKNSADIRSVCLGGFTRAGKTSWMLSLTGMLYYPDGHSQFSKAFPSAWNFRRRLCKVTDLTAEAGIHHRVEEMWVTGVVPERTRVHETPLRYPVLFSTSRQQKFWKKEERNLIALFNDIAGEVVTDPVKLASLSKEEYAHLGATTDLIFLVPTQDLSHAAVMLEQFANGLGTVEFEKQAVDLKQINLIFAISQIDRLKYSSQRDEELLDILLREPYVWPSSGNPAELEEYIRSMQAVDADLKDWFNRNGQNLIDATSRFRSVRYCGFSAFGFHPAPESLRMGSDFCLPFEPQPIRAVDPLLWLFLDNGWLQPGRDFGI